jgi:UDP-3-O-[3-hydroxymyristoyl] glucosamine N-acyltransferase
MSQTIEEIAAIVGGNLSGGGATEIHRVASIETARQGEISFVEKAEFTDQAAQTKASCLLVPENFNHKLPCSFIQVRNPKLAFAKIAAVLQRVEKKLGIHKTAQIAESAAIGNDVFIGAFVCVDENAKIGDGTQIFDGVKISENVKIGADCVIFQNVSIYENVSIGNRVRLHAGVCLGAEGFGFVRDGANGYIKFPQIGTVVIEDEVEIGANSCVDRGALGETRIGKGTKIDNLVQIAHNVTIGERVVIASQTGISGSTVIEDDCVIGGQVGFGDHARVLSGAIIGSKAGVLPGKIVRAGVWWGVPVQPLDEYKRQNALVKSLPRLREEIKELKKQIEEIRNKTD